MVLDSQMGRAGSGRMYMSSRRRRPGIRVIGVAVVLVAVVVGCIMMIGGGGDEPVRNNDTPMSNNPGAAPIPHDPGMTQPNNNTPAPTAAFNQSPHRTPPPDTRTITPPAEEPKPKPKPKPQPVQPKPQPVVSQPPAHTTSNSTSREINQARTLIRDNRLVEARTILNQVLASDISLQTAQQVRRDLGAINQQLVFSPLIDKTDPYTAEHVIQSGEVLSKIAPRHDVPWKLLQDINRIPRPEAIRAGQRIKIIRGPFHLVVDKSDFRADLYLGSGADAVFIKSYPVGLGEYNSTPVGRFVVRKHSKLENPEWVNPRTRERFHGNDPLNPIGERWVGLRGIDTNTQSLAGYGLHGTIEPDSIGKQASMGCVRFHAEDIKQVYNLMAEEKSIVTIVP